MHECIVGMLNNYENTCLVTLNDLKDHIRKELKYSSDPKYDWLYKNNSKPYSLSDYCDARKTTYLTAFNYCPFCGKEINWKGIKKGVV